MVKGYIYTVKVLRNARATIAQDFVTDCNTQEMGHVSGASIGVVASGLKIAVDLEVPSRLAVGGHVRMGRRTSGRFSFVVGGSSELKSCCDRRSSFPHHLSV